MPITINGSGTVSGISAGGLPDDSIVTADIANGAVTQAKRSEQLTLGTAQASTSGTSIDFTGIPSWVKRVTVMLNGVSTSGTSNTLVRFGTSSGVVASGYQSGTGYIYTIANNSQVYQETTGFLTCVSSSAAMVFSGMIVFTNLSSNTWVAAGTLYRSDAGQMQMPSGTVTLSGTLDRVRITTINGTDTFDSGSINILYE